MLDASATLSWLVQDERDELAVEMGECIGEIGAVVPPLWRYEVQNALLLAVRRGRIETGVADRLLSQLASLAITVASLPPTLAAETPLARRFGLTIYDAAYLELALRLNTKLMTRDEHLRSAAVDLDVLWTP